MTSFRIRVVHEDNKDEAGKEQTEYFTVSNIWLEPNQRHYWDALRGASDKMVSRDLSGKRFGDLTAHVRATPTIGICKITDEEVELIDVPNGSWFCVCQCGHHTTAKAHELVWGMVTDCGKCEPPVCGVVLQK